VDADIIRQQDLFPKEAPTWEEGLTGRERKFVELYCKDRECFLNPTAAYIKAYGSKKQLSDSSIQSNPSRLMRDPKIKNSIARLLRSTQDETDQITEYQVLDFLKTLSFYDPKEIIDRDGNLKKSLDDMGVLSLCVTGIKRSRHGKEIKLFDRTKALAMLCNYLNITRPEERATVFNPVVILTDKEIEELGGEEPKTATEAENAEDAEYELVEA